MSRLLLLGANNLEAARQACAFMALGGTEVVGFLDNDPRKHGVHGFLTLADENKVFFRTSGFLHPECAVGIAVGIRWDDPSVGIEEWAAYPSVISKQGHQ